MAKILIVDDSPDLLDFVSHLLMMHNHEAETAQSQAEVQMKLPAITPDLVLLDVRLGGDNGRELCKTIRKEMPGRHIPILLLSASPDLLNDYEECEADGVVEKPFDVKFLIDKIEATLTKSY